MYRNDLILFFYFIFHLDVILYNLNIIIINLLYFNQSINNNYINKITLYYNSTCSNPDINLH